MFIVYTNVDRYGNIYNIQTYEHASIAVCLCMCVCVCLFPLSHSWGSWGHRRPSPHRVCLKGKALFSTPTKQISKPENWTPGPSSYPSHSLCSHPISCSNGVHCPYFAASPEPTFLLSSTARHPRLTSCFSAQSRDRSLFQAALVHLIGSWYQEPPPGY